jgi:tRNA(Ile)-lysidine synthase
MVYGQELGRLLKPFPRRLGLAVSGGVDSMAMSYLTLDYTKRLKDPPKLSTFTIDHCARPGSDEEADKVRENLISLGFEDSQVLKMNWDAMNSGSKFELEARNNRIQLLYDACRVKGISHLLFAHTLDDQLETFVMRLIRGSSTNGLAGMHQVNNSPFLLPPSYPPLTFVRPLMSYSKQQLYDICVENSVPWVEDPTNYDPVFTVRNTVRDLLSRSEVLPSALRPENLKSTLQKVQKNTLEIEQQTHQALLKLINMSLINVDPNLGCARLSTFPRYSEYPVSVRASILFRTVQRIMPYHNPSYKFSAIDSIVRNHPLKSSTFDVANLQIQQTANANNTIDYLITRQNPYKDQLPKITLPIDISCLNEWTKWHLFDGRYWFRFKSTIPTRVKLTLSDPPGPSMKQIQGEDFSTKHWPPKKLVKLQPLLLDQNDSPIGYPTLNKYRHNIDHLQVQYSLKSFPNDPIPNVSSTG